MKKIYSMPVLFIICLVFTVCMNQERIVIYKPEIQDADAKLSTIWEITDFQNKSTNGKIPEWVNTHLHNKLNELEAADYYTDKYLFAGENNGNNFSALNQWADSFRAEQDLPMLVAGRIEKRMVSAAALYPDYEYGEFFEVFMKAVYDAKYSRAEIEDMFWIKRLIISSDTLANNTTIEEPYEFFVLVSIDKTILQNHIRGIMNEIKTKKRLSKEQAAAVNRIKQILFEGF